MSDGVDVYTEMVGDGIRPEEAGPMAFGVELWREMMKLDREQRRDAPKLRALRRRGGSA